jgi:hypothetical protein
LRRAYDLMCGSSWVDSQYRNAVASGLRYDVGDFLGPQTRRYRVTVLTIDPRKSNPSHHEYQSCLSALTGSIRAAREAG